MENNINLRNILYKNKQTFKQKKIAINEFIFEKMPKTSQLEKTVSTLPNFHCYFYLPNLLVEGSKEEDHWRLWIWFDKRELYKEWTTRRKYLEPSYHNKDMDFYICNIFFLLMESPLFPHLLVLIWCYLLVFYLSYLNHSSRL